jgi:hypothetical protein
MPPPKPAGISSKIMGLKFMQRHAKQQATSPATPASTIGGSPAVSTASADASPAAPVPAPNPSKWTLDLPAAAAAAVSAGPVVLLEDAQHEGAEALMRFRPGRRSFGAFNSRLEKRLGDISTQQRAAADELAAVARQEAARQKAAAERAALMEKAEAHERAEKQMGAIADEEFASHYAKYVPKHLPGGKRQAPSGGAPDEPLLAPPEASRPVQVSDAPLKKPQPALRAFGGDGRVDRSEGVGGPGGKKRKNTSQERPSPGKHPRMGD